MHTPMKSKTCRFLILLILSIPLAMEASAQQILSPGQNRSESDLPYWPKADPVKAANTDAVIDQALKKGPFDANWESLKQYEVPEWFRDTKFGIFVHWGPVTLESGTKADATDAAMFDWETLANRFRGHKFDANHWARAFRKAGAKYVVQVVEHHDAYAMYDSEFTPWSSVTMAPKRDFAKELSDATRKEGMIYGASSHTEEHWWFYSKPRKPTPPAPASDRPTPPQPDKEFLDTWLRRLSDIIEKYKPQIVWFDWVIEQPSYETYLQKFAAYYYNRAAEWKQGVVLNYKYQAFPHETAVLNVSAKTGVRASWQPLGTRSLPWQFDTMSSQAWFWKPDMRLRPTADMIGELVDVVSKNGNYLLNITPDPDGILGSEQERLLKEFGKWLKINGEAIYGTRPWAVYGEGPNSGLNPDFNGVVSSNPYTSQDIRFVGKGDILYAVSLAIPEKEISISSLGQKSKFLSRTIKHVNLVGSRKEIKWKQEPDALVIQLPTKIPCDYALSFKIEFEK
jgi:alpha-L-fucosidase